MDIPTFTISEHAARTEGKVVSTFEEVSELRDFGKDVAIISWLPPRYFATVDDAAAGPADESFFTQASILAWQEEVAHQEGESVNGSTIYDDDYDDTSVYVELERLYHYEREEMRAEWKRLTTERRVAIERAPFAYTTQGIVVANWLGDHKHWKRAWNAAIDVVKRGKMLQHAVIDILYTGYREHKHLVTIRHELSALTEERHLVPNTYRLTSQLMAGIFKENPKARLNPFYVLTNIENEDVARLAMQRLHERMLRPWFIALAQSSDDEGRPWISLESKHKLLALVEQGRFFLFEFLPKMNLGGYPQGTIAYAPILGSKSWTEGRPLGIGIALRCWNTLRSNFYCMDALLYTVLHELGHVLDSGDPQRERGADTEQQHQPGCHDRDWKRAFQYALNLAFRIGLIKDGENWTMADFDANFDTYVASHRITKVHRIPPAQLRQELKGMTPGGVKRTREEEEDSRGGDKSQKTSFYLS